MKNEKALFSSQLTDDIEKQEIKAACEMQLSRFECIVHAQSRLGFFSIERRSTGVGKNENT